VSSVLLVAHRDRLEAGALARTAAEWLRELWEQDGQRLGIPSDFPRLLGEAIEIVPPIHTNPDAIVDRQA